MTTFYRALTADYLTNPRMTPDMALIMNYLLAQANGFEINKVHLHAVFRGRIGQDRIKKALAALAREGYVIVQKPERRDGRWVRKPSKVSHAQCVYAGRPEGVNTTPSELTPISTTMKELNTEGVKSTPSVDVGISGSEDVTSLTVIVPDLSTKAPLSSDTTEARRTSETTLDCPHCGEHNTDPGKLSMHIFRDHPDRYDEFMTWFTAYKSGQVSPL